MKKILGLLLKRPLLIFVFVMLSSAAGFYYTTQLKVRSDFTVLLPPHFDSVQNMAKMDETYGGLTYLYVLIHQSDDLQETRRFVDEAKVALENIPEINYALEKLPIDYFEKRQGLYVELEDLQEIDRRVKKSLENSEKFGTSPVFSELADLMDPEDSSKLDLSDIQAKYKDKFRNLLPNEERKDYGSSASYKLSWDPRDEGYYYNPEEKFFVLWVKSQISFLNFDANQKLLGTVNSTLNDLNQKDFSGKYKYDFTGSYKTLLDQNMYLRTQVVRVFAVVFLLLFLLITVFYRNIFYNILIGLPLVVSITWSGALTYFLIGHVNIITSFTGFVLLGLGSDYAIFILGRFEQERLKNPDLLESLWETYKSAGRASLSAYLTTLAGFAALLFSQFLGFFEFGLVGAIGMTTNYFGILLLMPSLLWMMNKFNLFEKGKLKFSFLDRFPNVFEFLAKMVRHGKVFSLLTIMILIVGFFVLPRQFKIEFKDSGIANKSLKSWQLEEKVKEVVGKRVRPPTILTNSLEQEKLIVDALLTGPTKENVKDLVYLGMFVPDNQQEKKALAKGIAANLEKLDVPKTKETRKWIQSLKDMPTFETITRDSLPETLRKLFLPIKNDVGVFSSIWILHQNMDLGKREGIKKLPAKFSDIELANGDHISAIHEGFVVSDILTLVEKEGPKALLLIFVFLTIVVILDFRNLRKSLIVLLPMLATIPLLAAFSFFFGVRLNILNVSLVPIIFAIGIDSFLHYFHFYDEAPQDLVDVSRGILPAVFMATFTSLIGFGGFVVANTGYLRSMGWLSIIGIVMIFLLVALVFPKWIQLWERKPKRKT